ncbi:hypothetical protein CIW72_12035 [Xanthomonas citri pv. malvacearum]|nr:hypothetical protein CIW72_11985 [Xanthomonas citri pv. malvacearum]ASY88993.1 hypothetical protein CIW72_12035 [Xanthomonas citri pv. malvacearum]
MDAYSTASHFSPVQTGGALQVPPLTLRFLRVLQSMRHWMRACPHMMASPLQLGGKLQSSPPEN